jgi:prepilin-type N-terminal cleavage/methylation domain-containing protein
MRHTTRSGFTLIELLVVIAIIALLAAILFPVFAKAREKARQTACSNNQRQLATAILLYAQDHEETLPESAAVWGDLTIDQGVRYCPTKGKKVPGYVYYDRVGGKTIGDLGSPTMQQLSADGITQAGAAAAYVAYTAAEIEMRHNTKLISSYLDGHVELTRNTGFMPANSQPNCWLKADDCLNGFNPNDPVNLWPDASGNSRSAYQNTANLRPILLTNFLNTKPVLYFNTGQYLAVNGAAFNILQVYVVAKAAAPWTNVTTQLGNTSYGQGRTYELSADSKTIYTDPWPAMVWVNGTDYGYKTGTANPVMPAYMATNWVILTVNIGSANRNYQINNADWNYQAPQYIAEIIAFPTVQNAENREQIVNYLKLKYGL